jgi:hypothetical protein
MFFIFSFIQFKLLNKLKLNNEKNKYRYNYEDESKIKGIK